MSAADWVQATDPASGDPYWWNEKTGESTWENPVPVAGKDDSRWRAFATRCQTARKILPLLSSISLDITDEDGCCVHGYRSMHIDFFTTLIHALVFWPTNPTQPLQQRRLVRRRRLHHCRRQAAGADLQEFAFSNSHSIRNARG